MKSKWKAVLSLGVLWALLITLFPANAAALDTDEIALYHTYRQRFDAIQRQEDIAENGFRIIDSQSFDMEHEELGILTLLPAIHEDYGRVALFFALEDGVVALKTDDFMANSWVEGQLAQTNREVICISCVADLDGDGLADIIIITSCQNDPSSGAESTYTIGDVLFQNETGFYRDPRISDKINRFDMNKSAEYISAFVLDGVSMEFLFVAKDLDQLLAGGFKPINYLRVSDHFEKFGVVEVVPGYFSMTGQNYLMIYIVGQDGDILWNFQPMQQYLNFYDILDMSLKDIDGDGNKDLTVLARYVDSAPDGGTYLKTDYAIYYQRAGYFLEDTEVKRAGPWDEGDDMESIISRARQNWGWPQ